MLLTHSPSVFLVKSYLPYCSFMFHTSFLSVYVDLKPEGFPLTQLRNKEGEPWRKVMDLERALCFSSAKINSIVFMGNMMVMCTFLVFCITYNYQLRLLHRPLPLLGLSAWYKSCLVTAATVHKILCTHASNRALDSCNS